MRVLNDGNYRQQVERFVNEQSEAIFNHSTCPDCCKEYAEPRLKKLKQRKSSRKQSLPRAAISREPILVDYCPS